MLPEKGNSRIGMCLVSSAGLHVMGWMYLYDEK